MNTTEKGNILEKQIYDWLQPIVDEGVYGKYAKLQRHKQYKTISSKIILDVSIDLYLSIDDLKNDIPYNTIIFECKNHNNTTNIRCYDEWIGKLSRLGSSGFKIYLVSRLGFSKETIESARQNHVGLIKCINDCKIEYILKRSINDYKSYEQSLKDLLYTEKVSTPVIVYNEYRFTTIIDSLISDGVPIKKEMLLHAPVLKNEHIEQIANELLDRISNQNEDIDILDKILSLYPDLVVQYTKSLPPNQLGRFDMPNKIINLNEILKKDKHRYRFTLAHELGHLILHYETLKNRIDYFGDSEDTLRDLISDEESKWFERQANKFASYLLMPKKIVNKYVEIAFKVYSINRGRLYIDMQPCNQNNYHNVLGYLSSYLNVSKSALAFRLIDLNLMIITDDAKSII